MHGDGLGVFTMRGKVIPVIDLRLRFGMEGGVKILLDIDKVLSSEEITALEKAA